jgi:hypothetical protein
LRGDALLGKNGGGVADSSRLPRNSFRLVRGGSGEGGLNVKGMRFVIKGRCRAMMGSMVLNSDGVELWERRWSVSTRSGFYLRATSRNCSDLTKRFVKRFVDGEKEGTNITS